MCEIIDLRTIRPLDMDTVIASVKKTGRLVTVEEGFPQSSVGDHIASQIVQRAFDYLDAPVITICGKDVPMPYAANLEKLALPNVGRSDRGGQSRDLQVGLRRMLQRLDIKTVRYDRMSDAVLMDGRKIVLAVTKDALEALYNRAA